MYSCLYITRLINYVATNIAFLTVQTFVQSLKLGVTAH